MKKDKVLITWMIMIIAFALIIGIKNNMSDADSIAFGLWIALIIYITYKLDKK